MTTDTEIKKAVLEEYLIWAGNRLNNKPITQLEINDKLQDLTIIKTRAECEKEMKEMQKHKDFVMHIYKHLTERIPKERLVSKPEDVVCCKICNKTVNQISEKSTLAGAEKEAEGVNKKDKRVCS